VEGDVAGVESSLFAGPGRQTGINGGGSNACSRAGENATLVGKEPPGFDSKNRFNLREEWLFEQVPRQRRSRSTRREEPAVPGWDTGENRTPVPPIERDLVEQVEPITDSSRVDENAVRQRSLEGLRNWDMSTLLNRFCNGISYQ